MILNTSILKVAHLKKYFLIKGEGLFGRRKDIYAVDGVSFTIDKQETLGLVGESGCGKTTVGRCLLQLIEPTSGEIFFEGMNIVGMSRDKMRDLRREMQIIFQDPYGCLTPRMRLSALLMEPLEVHSIGTRSERKDRVAYILERVGLRPEHMQRYPHEFSGGQRQRISIARALMVNPKLIIADEPVSALDVSIRAQILNLLVELQQEFYLAYLLISHDLSVVKYMCDRIAVMSLGKIVEMAHRDEIYENYQHPYTEALLSAIPVPAVRERRGRIVLKGDVPSPINPPLGCRFHPRCSYRVEQCDQIEPELKDLGDGHFVACHLR
jgi:oligopeptide transport system ATP-binding protein